jgi:hypothetical protein
MKQQQKKNPKISKKSRTRKCPIFLTLSSYHVILCCYDSKNSALLCRMSVHRTHTSQSLYFFWPCFVLFLGKWGQATDFLSMRYLYHFFFRDVLKVLCATSVLEKTHHTYTAIPIRPSDIRGHAQRIIWRGQCRLSQLHRPSRKPDSEV